VQKGIFQRGRGGKVGCVCCPRGAREPSQYKGDELNWNKEKKQKEKIQIRKNNQGGVWNGKKNPAKGELGPWWPGNLRCKFRERKGGE